MIPKYRAWLKNNKEIIDVDEIAFNTKWIRGFYKLDCHWFKFEEIDLMQSTGLCDKAGTEVFEGDILHHQIQTDYTFIVKYDKDNGRWYGDGLSRTYRIDITKDFLQYYKVIGNIYENKELLENKVEAVLMDKTVTAYRLAKETGISQSTITRLRNKERLFKNITVDTLIKMQSWIEKNGK